MIFYLIQIKLLMSTVYNGNTMKYKNVFILPDRQYKIHSFNNNKGVCITMPVC